MEEPCSLHMGAVPRLQSQGPRITDSSTDTHNVPCGTASLAIFQAQAKGRRRDAAVHSPCWQPSWALGPREHYSSMLPRWTEQ